MTDILLDRIQGLFRYQTNSFVLAFGGGGFTTLDVRCKAYVSPWIRNGAFWTQK